jgi:hypothetical protein
MTSNNLNNCNNDLNNNNANYGTSFYLRDSSRSQSNLLLGTSNQYNNHLNLHSTNNLTSLNRQNNTTNSTNPALILRENSLNRQNNNRK